MAARNESLTVRVRLVLVCARLSTEEARPIKRYKVSIRIRKFLRIAAAKYQLMSV